MSEKKLIPQKGGAGGGGAQIQAHLRGLEAGELAEELAERLDDMDADSFDPEVVDLYLDALEEQQPLASAFDVDAASAFDVDAALDRFREDHALMLRQSPAIEGKGPKARPVRRRLAARIGYAAALAALSCLVAAQAFGVDMFGPIARWTQETFQFAAASPQEADEVDTAALMDYGVFAPLQEAVRDNGITEPVVPRWCPNGFVPAEALKVTNTEGMTVIHYPFENGDQFFSVTIRQFAAAEDTSSVFFEKDGRDVVVYEQNGISHYMMHNLEQVQAAWTSGTVVASISGDLSFRDLETMIDSIYGG